MRCTIEVSGAERADEPNQLEEEEVKKNRIEIAYGLNGLHGVSSSSPAAGNRLLLPTPTARHPCARVSTLASRVRAQEVVTANQWIVRGRGKRQDKRIRVAQRGQVRASDSDGERSEAEPEQ